MEEVRLNKYLSDRGVCSRRDADRLTETGAITVNGIRAVPGQKVTEVDQILVNGRPVSSEAPAKRVFAVNKPVDVVCTTRSFKGERNILELVPGDVRLYPVGRLDKDSQGLILLTNDGALAEELTNAAGRHEKEYEVTVNKEITDAFIHRMERGIFLKELDRTTSKCRVTRGGEKSFRIVLTQGLNRQIRRMCEVCGYEVRSLKRIRIMNILLDEIPEGGYRELKGEELRILRQALSKKADGKQTEKRAERENGKKKEKTREIGRPDSGKGVSRTNGKASERKEANTTAGRKVHTGKPADGERKGSEKWTKRNGSRN